MKLLKHWLMFLLLGAAAATPAVAAPTSTDPMFGPRALYGYGPWLASFAGQPALGVGEPVTLFAAGHKPTIAVITALEKPGAPGYPKAGILARGPDAAPVVVALTGAVPIDAPVMAVRALAPFHKLVGGVATPVTGRSLTALLDGARLVRRKTTLVKALRFSAPGQPAITDVFLGEPTWNPGGKTMRRVEIQRVTFVGPRRVHTKGYARRGGVPERAEAEPVTLTAASWTVDSTSTLGFVGLPDGRWFRLGDNGGPEGIHYRIENVSSGEIVFDAYHYTPH